MKPIRHLLIPRPRPTRRRFLQTAVPGAAGLLLTRRAAAAKAPRCTVLDTAVISADDRYYHGWPTLARLKDGRLAVVCSGGREAHICPFGRVDLYISRDGGATWSWPRTLLDSDGDDRDAGLLETARGTLLATTFTSLAYEPILAAAEKKGTWDAAKLRRWKAAQGRVDEAARKAGLGEWMIRSTDGGVTWSARQPTIVNSPHGPIQLADGRLLYAGKELWTEQKRNGVCVSEDDGATWRWLAEIAPRPGDLAKDYHELHAVECADGRLVVQIRNHNKRNAGETLQTESADGGRTWSEPHDIGVWGLPSHLLRLRDGRLLMTYGHRRAPFGNQARISADGGRTWSEPMSVSADGAGGDLGYPSTVELDDGALITVWYEAMKDRPLAVLRQARWKFAD